MGNRGVIQQAVNKALTAVGDIASSSSYWRTGTPSYNATTGVITRNETEYPATKAVFVSYRRDEIDGEVVRQEDQKCLISVLGLAIIPTLNDRIVDSSAISWEVVGIREDPAGALWTLQVRRP